MSGRAGERKPEDTTVAPGPGLWYPRPTMEPHEHSPTRAPFFGCLTRPHGHPGIGGRYTYRRRGTRAPLFPDLVQDAGGATGEIPFGQGSLCTVAEEGASGVAWKAASLLDFGVDILLRFDEEVHAAQLVLFQDTAQGSGLRSVEVFRQDTDAESLVPVGRADGGSGAAIEAARVDVALGVSARNLLVRLHACYRPIALRGLAVYGAVLSGPVVYPPPGSYEILEGEALLLTAVEAIVVAGPASQDALFAAHLFAEELRDELHVELPVRREDSRAGDPRPTIRIDQTGDPKEPERYRVDASASGVELRASGRRGLVYGLETLLALLRQSSPGPSIPPCRIDDHPAMELRGVHLGLPPREEIPFLKRLVRSLLVPMRYNTVFLEFAGGMELERRPEINRAWIRANEQGERGEAPPFPHGSMVAGGRCLSKAEVRDLVAFMKELGLEVIPEVQSLSHVQYLTAAYPHIAEREPPRRQAAGSGPEKADALPPELYPHCYCPSLEESYDIVFDLIDEIVEVVRPERYVHMGHDEVYTIGVCERCRDKSPADLFAGHVLRMRDHLLEKGLGTMIWSDMLQDITSYRTPGAIDRIPPDVVMLDFIWYFHFDRDIEDSLLRRGFSVAMGNMYSSHYPRFEARRRKPGVIGAEVSTWLRADEYTLGTEGKIYDFLYSAAMIWWDGYRNELRRSLDRVLTAMMPALRDRLGGAVAPSRSPGATFVILPLPEADGDPALAAMVGAGPRSGGGIPFRLGAPLVVRPPREATVPVGIRLDGLAFLHATTTNAPRVPWQPLTRVAEYVVRYRDGVEARVPVEYGGTAAPLCRAHAEPMTNPIYRHQGYIGTYFADPVPELKDGRGGDLTLYAWEWRNPRSEEPIDSLLLRGCAPETDCALALFAVTGVRRAGRTS